MNYIWFGLIVISIISAMFNGKIESVVEALFDGVETAVKISIYLIGVMAFWMGIMKIAEKSGFTDFVAKLVKPLAKKLFPEIADDDEAISDITFNLSANALGVSNAATPIGIKAMERMQLHNKEKDTATNSMCTFLAMNTAGFQLIPTTVIAILAANGVKNPTVIILPALIVTSITFIFSIIIVKILEKFSKKVED